MKKLVLTLLCLTPLLISQAQILEQANELINNYQFKKALKVLSKEPDSLDSKVLLQSGYCYLRLGSYKAAMLCYGKVLKTDSLNRTALNQLGQLYARNSDYAGAKACYEKLIRIDSLNSFYFKQYASLASSNDVPQAISLFKKALLLNPDDEESSNLYGSILLNIEDYHSLDSLVSRQLSRDSTQSSLVLLKAKSEIEQHHYKDVIGTIGKLLTKGDTTATYARLLGISYFQLNEYAKVVQCMQFLLNAKQKADWIHYYMGVSYRELRNLPKSIESMSLAIEEGITENIGTYYSQLASSYEEKGDFRNAIHFYKAAYESSRSNILLYHLARNYDTYYKDKSQAISYYKKYLNSDDTIKLAKEYTRYRLHALSDKR